MSSRISQSDELEEIIYYITEMRRKVNSKMDDFFFIIEQQNKRIHELNSVIDELAWQLRDLRDSVRETNSKRDHCACNYENHVPSMKNSIRVKLGQSSKNNLNMFEDQKNNDLDDDQFDDAECDNNVGQLINFSSNNKKAEQSHNDDGSYEPIEFNNNTLRINNLKQEHQQNSSSNTNNDNSGNHRASLKKLLNNENNYDNKMKKVQYSKSYANTSDFDNSYRKERNKVREAQSEIFVKPNISIGDEEDNNEVVLRRQTVVLPKSNRSSYSGSSSAQFNMSDIEEEHIIDTRSKMKPEPKIVNYSRQKMRPSSFKTTF